jgi:hypothetical protein
MAAFELGSSTILSLLLSWLARTGCVGPQGKSAHQLASKVSWQPTVQLPFKGSRFAGFVGSEDSCVCFLYEWMTMQLPLDSWRKKRLCSKHLHEHVQA